MVCGFRGVVCCVDTSACVTLVQLRARRMVDGAAAVSGSSFFLSAVLNECVTLTMQQSLSVAWALCHYNVHECHHYVIIIRTDTSFIAKL